MLAFFNGQGLAVRQLAAKVDEIYRFYEPRGLRAGFVFLASQPSPEFISWARKLVAPVATVPQEGEKEIREKYLLNEDFQNLILLSRLNQIREVFYNLQPVKLEEFVRRLEVFWNDPLLLG